MPKPYIDTVYIFETNDILNYLNTEITNIYNKIHYRIPAIQILNTSADIMQIKDTLIYTAIRNVLRDLGYIINGDNRYYNTKYSNLIKLLSDLYYPYIIKHISLDLNHGYIVRTVLVNSSTHLFITKVNIHAAKNNS